MDTHITSLVSWRARRTKDGPFVQFKASSCFAEAMEVAEKTLGGKVASLYRTPKLGQEDRAEPTASIDEADGVIA